MWSSLDFPKGYSAHTIQGIKLSTEVLEAGVGIYGPASCHPTLTSFPEENYLTAVLVAVV